MTRMKARKWAALTFAALMLFVMAGCSKPAKEKAIDLNAFCEQAIKTVAYDDDMILLPESAATDFYGLPLEGLEQYVIYSSGTMATANELAVMKLSDDKAVEAAKKMVERRLEDQRANYENYNPQELFRIEKAIVTVENHVLLFSVCNDNESVKKLFLESFH